MFNNPLPLDRPKRRPRLRKLLRSYRGVGDIYVNPSRLHPITQILKGLVSEIRKGRKRTTIPLRLYRLDHHIESLIGGHPHLLLNARIERRIILATPLKE